MAYFFEKRLSLAEAIAASTVGGVWLQYGWLPACGAAAALATVISIGRALSRVQR
jgi:hypothetical protein